MDGQKGLLIGAAVVLSPLLIVVGVILIVVLAAESAVAECNPTEGLSVEIDPASVPDGVAGYDHEQMTNAAHIIQVGSDLGLSGRDITIGVMTAIGESTLRNLRYGDDIHGVTNPDGSATCSLGLYQQQWCLEGNPWGTREQVLDPQHAAGAFFEKLQEVEGRDQLSPTMAAHRVQRNADPGHYAPFFDDAVQIVETISGADLGITQTRGDAACSATSAATGTVTAGGWAMPSEGPVTSHFGMRTNPVTGIYTLHAGTDLDGAGCDGPIWAAQDGKVIYAGMAPGAAGSTIGQIDIDHGRGVMTRYLHMWPHGINVRVGQDVSAGDQIGLVGNSGNSTACHLHYEVHVGGEAADPEKFMADAGAPLS